MASVIENEVWTLTDEAAQLLVQRGILRKCEGIHHPAFIDIDYPIYHFASSMGNPIGYNMMGHYIREAQKELALSDIESLRVYYVHDSTCDGESFEEPDENGLKTCLDCAGIFDKDGKGIAVTDKRLDAPPEE